jgi:2-polyprenyl-6-methoxyphenol hydroxylase-like FAD-dependent oxidoreductase
MHRRTEAAVHADVAIVGYGPVGQTAAALLAQHGHRVAVYERYGDLYRRPRAAHFDDEAMRVWQTIGIVDEIAGDLLPATTYDWFGADGEQILRIEQHAPGPSGWARGYLFYQPDLETALDRTIERLDGVTLHRGWNADGLSQHGDHAVLTLRRAVERQPGVLEVTEETTTVRARYIIGADGANSFVRQAAGVALDDLGFAEHWVVADIRPHDIEALAHLPVTCQWCDPDRPHMHSRIGRRHRRFEFMLLPDERPEDFEDTARMWELLAPWMTPDDGELVRHTVYEFRGRVAETARAGRVLLVGDAAHTMPPFLGQGLCSGVRDIITLVWRLDLVLRGLVDDRVLDAYNAERRPQIEWIVNLSAEMGRVSCVLDADAAAERDAALRAADAPPPIDFPPLPAGLLAAGAPLAGARAIQGTVRHGERSGRFDDVIGRGFVLLTTRRVRLTADQAAFLLRIGGDIAALDGVEDLDGRLTAWLDEHGVEAVLIRPDFYVFGAGPLDAIPELLDDLRSQLSITDEGPPQCPPTPPSSTPSSITST